MKFKSFDLLYVYILEHEDDNVRSDCKKKIEMLGF